MIRIFAMLLFSSTAFAIVDPEQAPSDWWKAFSRESSGKSKILDVYKKCHAAAPSSDEKTICRGIFGPNCIKDSYCDFIFRVTETKDEFEFESLNLESYRHDKMPNKNMGYMIGFAPFQKIGNNLTSKCKSAIGLKDFKFFVYKLNMERRSRSDDQTDRVNWDSINKLGLDISVEPISKKKFAKSCELRLEERNHITTNQNRENGGRILHHANAVMRIGEEFMFIVQAKYFDNYSNDEKMVLRDGAQYRSTDGVLYTNFDNEVLPKDKKMFQVPASEFSHPPASASIFIPSFLTETLVCLVLLVVVLF